MQKNNLNHATWECKYSLDRIFTRKLMPDGSKGANLLSEKLVWPLFIFSYFFKEELILIHGYELRYTSLAYSELRHLERTLQQATYRRECVGCEVFLLSFNKNLIAFYSQFVSTKSTNKLKNESNDICTDISNYSHHLKKPNER